MPSIIEKVLLLQNVDLFSDVPTEQLAHLAAIADEVAFDAGTTVYEEGEPADSLYMILDGKVRLHRAQQEITIAEKTDVFGTWALFDDSPRVVTAEALEQTRALRIDRFDFVDLLADHVQITQGVLKTMADRLRNLLERVGAPGVGGGTTGP